MRKLASVVRISGTSPIENADRLEVAEMEGKGWRVVTQKGEFKKGDLAVYFEIDSALPFDDDRYEFLRERCVRKFVTKSGELLHKVLKIKTLKLRGVVSQGLLIPISKYPEITNVIIKTDDESNPMFMNTVRGEAPAGCDEICYKNQEEPLIGADVSFMLKVEHFDEVAERFRPISSGNPIASDAYGKFPSDWIPKTDEERCVDGNTTIITTDGIKKIKDIFKNREKEFHVLSRNNKTGKDEFKRVINVYKSSKTNDWYKITTETGETIIVTSNHKIFLPTLGVYRTADLLTTNDYLLINTDQE